MNRRGDVPALVTALRELAGSADVANYTHYEALAATRDLGVLLASIKRHGVEPLHAAPETLHVLLTLAESTDMAPRDTVFHYAPWNPTGSRRRMFTADPQEGSIIDSACLSTPWLARAVDLCSTLMDMPLDDPEFAPTADSLAESLRALEPAIDLVIAQVDPRFFARTLRPYFEEVEIGERTYPGGAGAGLPVPLIDLTLWAADHGDADYKAFWSDGAHYTLPQWRALYPRFEKGPSLVTKVTAALAGTTDGMAASALHTSAAALERCLRALVVFRAKHFTIAKKAYQHEVRLYPVGSSGGSTGLLDNILTLTRESVTMVRHLRPPDQSTRGQ